MVESIQYAPVIVFAFNRLEPLKACIASLLNNSEAISSDLFVYVDGPRKNKEGEAEKVKEVREFVKTITGFRSLTFKMSEINNGLATSIIAGTTDVISKYGKAIVLEDDLVVSGNFLSFMNLMLDTYKNDDRIMQVTGFSIKIRKSLKYNCDYYLSGRAHSWSWGTWVDRWTSIDWEVLDYDELLSDRKMQNAFNTYGSDLFGMLRGWREGKNNSWFIRFDYSMFKQGKYCIAPIRSLVKNDGFRAGATHTSGYNRFKVDFNDDGNYQFRVLDNLEWDRKLSKHAVRYWSIPYRIYGKILTYLTFFLR